MALETKLVQKLSQSLMMTPQLQQAIKLLQLGRLEYKEAIERELLENPILEEMKEEGAKGESSEPLPQFAEGGAESAEGDAPEPKGDAESKVDWEGYLESFTDHSGSATPKGTFDFEDRPQLENTLTRAESLSEYLYSQLRLLDIDAEEKRIGVHIIGNLDKDGYLCASIDEIAAESGHSPTEIECVLDIIKELDPPGIGAQDLGQCLLIQLEHMGLGDGVAAKIVRDHLDKLEKRKYDQIAKELQVPVQSVYQAVTTIQALEPRPGRPFADDETRYITPDVYVQKVSGEWVITLNEDGLPKLRISPYYLKLLQDSDPSVSGSKSYLHERLKAASWLIKSIHQRQQTIYRVAESIIKFQKEFLDYGIDKLKPLVLKDVAQDIGMHESTVSRVTTSKYIHTPQGVFELKYFFTTGIKSASGDMSSSSVKERIRNIIVAEDPKNPISDQDIVEMLQKENIDIARRTVAKYRETLGILSSAKRKKLF